MKKQLTKNSVHFLFLVLIFRHCEYIDEAETSDVPTTASNVRKDLTEWQERHATLVLTTVKVIYAFLRNLYVLI